MRVLLILLISFMAIEGNAKGMCHSYLENNDVERKFLFSWESYRKKKNPSGLKTHLKAAMEQLDKVGVEYSVVEKDILIIPSQASELNRYAYRVFNRFNTLTFYSPENLIKFNCDACVEYNTRTLTLNYVNVSSEAVKIGRLTPAEFHEWRHVVEYSKLRKDKKMPALAGLIEIKGRQKDEAQVVTMEEYLTYFTEMSATISQYRKREITRAEALDRLKTSQSFLQMHTIDAILYSNKVFVTVENTFEGNKTAKVFQALTRDGFNATLLKSKEKGGVSFDFISTDTHKYRIEFTLANPELTFTLILRNQYEISGKALDVYLENMPLKDFQRLTNDLMRQTLETYLAINELYPLMFQRNRSVKNYEEFLIQYREILNRYL